MSHPTSSWILVPDTSRASSTQGNSNFTPGVDFLLDIDGDLDLSSGDLRFTTGLQAVAQGIWIRIQMFKGEWFLNLEEGIPYLPNDTVSEADALLGGKFSELRARAAFRKAIAAAPGVQTIDSLAVTFSAATRIMRVDFKVTTVAGTIEGSL